MIALLLGGAVLFLLLGGMRAFERASIQSIKALAVWIAALGGLVLAALLVLTGRGGIAFAALTLFGPLLWNTVRPALFGKPGAGASPGARPGARPPPSRGAMTREEALAVLGLQAGASGPDIQAAYIRLMRAAHPDNGGSDWLAARVNQARDVLVGR